MGRPTIILQNKTKRIYVLETKRYIFVIYDVDVL